MSQPPRDKHRNHLPPSGVLQVVARACPTWTCHVQRAPGVDSYRIAVGDGAHITLPRPDTSTGPRPMILSGAGSMVELLPDHLAAALALAGFVVEPWPTPDEMPRPTPTYEDPEV